MKKLLLLVLVFLLIGCEETTKEATYQLEAIKAMPEESIVKKASYVFDEWMPLYADLSSYPHESIIDWNEDTFLLANKETPLNFTFLKEEAVYSIEMTSQDIEGFVIQAGDYVKEVRGSTYTFLEPLITDQVTLTVINDSTIKLSECHILVGETLSEEEYNAYLNKKELVDIFQDDYTWFESIEDNIMVVQEILSQYDHELIEEISSFVDYSLLTDDAIGRPIELVGQAIDVENVHDHFHVLLKGVNSEEVIMVITENSVEMHNIFMSSGFYIGHDEHKVFYSIE